MFRPLRNLSPRHLGVIIGASVPVFIAASDNTDWGFAMQPKFILSLIVAVANSMAGVLMEGPDNGQRNRRINDPARDPARSVHPLSP